MANYKCMQIERVRFKARKLHGQIVCFAGRLFRFAQHKNSNGFIAFRIHDTDIVINIQNVLFLFFQLLRLDFLHVNFYSHCV